MGRTRPEPSEKGDLILMIYSFDYHWNCKGKIVVGHSWDVKVKAMKGTNLGVAQALFEPERRP